MVSRVRFAAVYAKQQYGAAAKIAFPQAQALPKPQLQVAQLCASSSTRIFSPTFQTAYWQKLNNHTSPPR